MLTKFRATLAVVLLCLFVSVTHAQVLTVPQLQTCSGATEGSPTTPWIQCQSGIKFVPISDGVLVATGDFNQGTWQVFGKISGETMVAYCPAGALLEAEQRCRTADGSTWATKFIRKDQLPAQRTWQIAYVWPLVTQYENGSPITVPVTYVLQWKGTDAAGIANTPMTEVPTAGPPLVITAPQQRICAIVAAKANGVLGNFSSEFCIAPEERKPGTVQGLTVQCQAPPSKLVVRYENNQMLVDCVTQ